MRRWALVLLLLPAWLWAEDGVNITDAVLIPPVFSVGDLVELRVTLVHPEGQEVRPIQSLPTQDWLVLRDVQIRHDAPFEHVTIKFIPFAPGEKTLPALKLGDITLDNLTITTRSVLDKAGVSGLEPPRDQLPFPHTEFFLTLLVVLLVVVPLLLWRFLQPALRWLTGLRRHLERHRPYHRLQRESRRLQARLSGLNGPEFYTQFLALVRDYLGARLRQDVSTLTAAEVAVALAPELGEDTPLWAALVHRADVVRFDSGEPSDAERLADLEHLRAHAKTLEDREARRVDV